MKWKNEENEERVEWRKNTKYYISEICAKDKLCKITNLHKNNKSERNQEIAQSHFAFIVISCPHVHPRNFNAFISCVT